MNLNQPMSGSDWVKVRHPAVPAERMRDRIVRVTADEKDLKDFYNVTFSQTQVRTLADFYQAELDSLQTAPFDQYRPQDKVDYVLLEKYLQRQLRRLDLKAQVNAELASLLPFASNILSICEARQKLDEPHLLEPEYVANHLATATASAQDTCSRVLQGCWKCDATTAFRAMGAVKELRSHWVNVFSFFTGYDPKWDWWVTSPHRDFLAALDELVASIETAILGIRPGDNDIIVGDPIGRDGLLAELQGEVVAYTPEQLITVAEREYTWCESEMKRAARELGYGDDWKAALDHVRAMHNRPGEQVGLIRRLVDEGATYVSEHDLITVPAVCTATWHMNMMSPTAQKVNPFFLGGQDLIVSYPTDSMPHADKLASMRANCGPLSRATAFHEMVPGHHLQGYMAARFRPHRRVFSTPFLVEGWATYWELVLWSRGDFFVTPADRVGTLFWRMHRCVRVVFSLRFHLGLLTPSQCVDMLVDRVGHERPTAEGEVRRSLAGEYSPLYQAAYLLGALQLWRLREDVLAAGTMHEKAFHDAVLRNGEIPIEILRALLMGGDLERGYAPKWRFYGDV